MYSAFVVVLSLFLGLVSAVSSPDIGLRQVATSTVVDAQATTTLASASSAAAVFVMPGTTLQVLPVGLGVYGGITSIAIFVVVFVTWERVQYRKAFRQQRMVESTSFTYSGSAKDGLIN